jgi:hypothetical protein
MTFLKNPKRNQSVEGDSHHQAQTSDRNGRKKMHVSNSAMEIYKPDVDM